MQKLDELLILSKIRVVNFDTKRLQKLNKKQEKIFNNFKKILLEKIEKDEINITYRGDRKSTLKQIIFQGKDKYHDYDFYARIFNIGGKN